MYMAQLMPLPLTVSCFSKIQIGFTFLVPAHLCSPGKRAVEWVCVCVCVCVVVCTVCVWLWVRTHGAAICMDYTVTTVLVTIAAATAAAVPRLCITAVIETCTSVPHHQTSHRRRQHCYQTPYQQPRAVLVDVMTRGTRSRRA